MGELIIEGQYAVVEGEKSLKSVKEKDLRQITYRERQQRKRNVAHEIVSRLTLKPQEKDSSSMKLAVKAGDKHSQTANALQKAGVHKDWVELDGNSQQLQTFFNMVQFVEKTEMENAPDVKRGSNSAVKNYSEKLTDAKEKNEKIIDVLVDGIDFENAPSHESNIQTIRVCSKEQRTTIKELQSARYRYDKYMTTSSILAKFF